MTRTARIVYIYRGCAEATARGATGREEEG